MDNFITLGKNKRTDGHYSSHRSLKSKWPREVGDTMIIDNERWTVTSVNHDSMRAANSHAVSLMNEKTRKDYEDAIKAGKKVRLGYRRVRV